MNKYILFLSILALAYLQANSTNKEVLIWQEIKNSKDIKDFRYYLSKYPNGAYKYFADKNIKKLSKQIVKTKILNDEPYWIGDNKITYRYYGIGKASKHFRGKNYTINLAKNIAIENLLSSFGKNNNLDENTKIKYLKKIKTQIYQPKYNVNTYVMVYIENYDN